MVTEGIEPSTVALLAQRSNQLSYATCLPPPLPALTNSLDRENQTHLRAKAGVAALLPLFSPCYRDWSSINAFW